MTDNWTWLVQQDGDLKQEVTNGKEATEVQANGFVKHDKEKPVYAYVDPEYEAGTARILTVGALKYAPFNWQRCTTPWRTYYSALRRHLDALSRGEVRDSETGELHWYHISCCTMFLAWFERHGLMVDRPGAGPAAQDGG